MMPLRSGRTVAGWLLVPICLAMLCIAMLCLATSSQAESPPFSDATKATGLDFVHFNGMTGEVYFSETPGGGGALLDFDRDGDLDLFLVQGHVLDPKKKGSAEPKDRLYRNDLIVKGKRGPLKFVDVTAASGLDSRGYGMGAAAGDIDNDGWPDLYITNFGANELWRNRGDGSFENVTVKTGTGDDRWSVPAAFFDYDADGWLDLYVGNYLDFRIANHKPCFGASGARDYCGPSAYDPESDRLWRNLGNGKFSDVGAKTGIGREAGGALGIVSGDFDGDGDLDFYVANDQLPNFLWSQQENGTFDNIALFVGCAVNGDGLAEASMGLDAGDVDGDGDEDLFMAHLSQETNTLYLNDGGEFEDATGGAALDLPSWAFTGFGTKMLDYDNDGWLDVLVVNGAIKTIEALARAGDPFPLHQTNQLFRNQGAGKYQEVTASAGAPFQQSAVSRGLAVGDLDNDGDSDAVVFNNNAAPQLLLNEVGQNRSWIGLEIWDSARNRYALGSRVGVFAAGEAPRWRVVRREGGYAASQDPRVLVGLGKASKIDKVRVEWAGGGVEEWSNLEARKYHRLTPGSGQPVKPGS